MTIKRWRKSSKSGTGANDCVELPHTLDQLRDSKNPDATVSVNVRAVQALVRWSKTAR